MQTVMLASTVISYHGILFLLSQNLQHSRTDNHQHGQKYPAPDSALEYVFWHII